jgi:hypothetical protein
MDCGIQTSGEEHVGVLLLPISTGVGTGRGLLGRAAVARSGSEGWGRKSRWGRVEEGGEPLVGFGGGGWWWREELVEGSAGR